jgi:branched-chain amino acid transport system ATP-binding protein/branched-chain amino acid transport system permease protein
VIVKVLLSLGVIILATLLPYLGLPGWSVSLATTTAFTALALIGLNLIYGMLGMLALGQAAFLALPAYFAGILTTAGVPVFLAIAAAFLLTILTARAVAEIFVRLPGIYFAIGTLGFAFVIEGLARAFPSVTGGASGLVLEAPIRLTSGGWYLVSLVTLAAAVTIYVALNRGAFARRLKLVRQDELAAEVLGVDVVKTKVAVFTIGSAFTATGGLLLAYYTQVVSPESGGVTNSVEALAMLVLGGAGSALGPLLGAFAVNWLFSVARWAGRFELLLYGVGFFFVILYARRGLYGLFFDTWEILARQNTSSETVAASAGFERQLRVSEDGRNAGASGNSVCLSMRGISKQFGGLQAVQDVGFEVRVGQIVGVIGPNGAGKSTLFNTISGLEWPDQGSIVLNGEDITRSPVNVRARFIGRSFQVPRLVPEMTVLENVIARLDQFPVGDSVQNESETRAYLDAFRLSDLTNQLVGRIGLGQHKIIELVRASVGAPPLLLLDEPAVGLASQEVQQLASLLRDLRARGAAILIVEHNVGFLAEVADEIVVMETGRIIAQGSPSDVMRNDNVKTAYLGAIA